MTTVFYRFPDEETLTNLAFDNDGLAIVPNLDVIGDIYTGGAWDEDGAVIEPPTKVPGYHVNTPEPMPGWEPYLVEPEPVTPYRIFAVKEQAHAN